MVHCDGVQAFCKVEVNLSNSCVDAYTISSHKIHGPKGVGALYLKKGVNLKPTIFGGGQEFGVRPGTENLPSILGFVRAAEIMQRNFEHNFEQVLKVKNKMIELINQKCNNFVLNSGENTSPYILSVSFKGVKGEVLLHTLEMNEIYVSTGSACSSKLSGNRVLNAMGQPQSVVDGNIRFSFCEENTTKEAEFVVECLSKALENLRRL